MSDLPTARPRPTFVQFLSRIENGDLAERLTRDLEEIVAACEQVAQDHGIQNGKGKLAIEIKVARKKGTYDIVIESKTTVPKAPAATETMWATADNGLVPENPRQQKLGFVEIVRPRGEA